MVYKQLRKRLSTILGKISKALRRNKYFVALLVIFSYVLYLLYPSFSCNGYLLNTDTYGHFYASWSTLTSLKQGVLFGNYDLYGGIDNFISYSPLFYYCFALFYLLVSKFISIQLAWIIYFFLIVLFISFGIFNLLNKLRFPFLVSLFTSLFAISFRYSMLSDFSPSVMYEIGLAPFVFSFIFLPYFLVNFFNLINQQYQKKYAIYSAILLTLILLAHLYTFLAVLVFVLFIVIVKSLNYLIRRRTKQTRIIHIVSFLILFLITSSFWIYAFIVDKPYSLATSNEKLPILSNVQYFVQLIHNDFGQGIDTRIPILLVFGLIGILTITCSQYLRKEKIFLLIFIISAIALSFGISNLLFIPSTTSFSGAHVYGRTLAFVKYFWIIFSAIGIYESIKFVVQLLTKKKLIFGRRLVTTISLLLLTIVLVIQAQLSKNQIRDYQAFKCFDKENNYFVDINQISNIIKSNSNLPGKILVDISFESSEKYIIPVLSGNHGLISHFPMDRTGVKAKKNVDELYQSMIDNSENTINFVNKLGIDFIVINQEKSKSSWATNYLINNNFSIQYQGKLSLLTRKGKSNFVESNKTDSNKQILVNYEMPKFRLFHKIIHRLN
ncbi:MAG: hypothetical protein UR93_C0024G0008 [Berkelbacteria bacterium GW2011_GWA2_35_9]|uniref:Membrane protein 6-pyruvoyl-tetrahydropterin synthase-related domain-containing protein n=1 Tax=Berkelbacteria bacterium GW2011_GWA2_35_9 TaxID=1618333 RepID=A0A0G0D175_9BACT|nr:MAG: hypothetical protein UR93_C0024G0008 [Berkelbacteria bacterium GW2011_GWA2_35_9]